jgi:hypothetical protein
MGLNWEMSKVHKYAKSAVDIGKRHEKVYLQALHGLKMVILRHSLIEFEASSTFTFLLPLAAGTKMSDAVSKVGILLVRVTPTTTGYNTDMSKYGQFWR